MKPKIFVITAVRQPNAPYPTYLMRESEVSSMAKLGAEILPTDTCTVYTAHSLRDILNILTDQLRIAELK